MIAFPSMLIGAAKQAGMSFPEDTENYDAKEFPHFFVFVIVQIGKPVKYHGEHFDNAKVIANISADDIFKVTVEDLIKQGLSF